jgi:hypothetical protein
MLAPQDQNNQRAAAQARSRSRAVGGVALMLFGVALMAYGAHYLTMNGTCSSTGYASFGPVPKCSGTNSYTSPRRSSLGPRSLGSAG